MGYFKDYGNFEIVLYEIDGNEGIIPFRKDENKSYCGVFSERVGDVLTKLGLSQQSQEEIFEEIGISSEKENFYIEIRKKPFSKKEIKKHWSSEGHVPFNASGEKIEKYLDALSKYNLSLKDLERLSKKLRKKEVSLPLDSTEEENEKIIHGPAGAGLAYVSWKIWDNYLWPKYGEWAIPLIIFPISFLVEGVFNCLEGIKGRMDKNTVREVLEEYHIPLGNASPTKEGWRIKL